MSFRAAVSAATALGLMTTLAACVPEQTAPVVAHGWDNYGYASAITCGARPVLLMGNRMDLTMTGPCSFVRVEGGHNDISIVVAPGGTIEITGAHNDVTWHVPPGARFTPILLDHGNGNTFHAPE
jgi:hypothetical protein